MLEHVGVIVGGEQGIHRNRDNARIHGPEKGHRPIGNVLHQQQHPLFALDSHGGQPACHAPHPLIELAVAERAVIIDESRLGRPPGIDSEHMLCKIERFGWWLHRLPRAPLSAIHPGVSPRHRSALSRAIVSTIQRGVDFRYPGLSKQRECSIVLVGTL